MGSFASQVAGFAQRAAARNDAVVRAAEVLLFRAVIEQSPIDTGQFVSCWTATVDAPADGTREAFSPGVKGSTKEANVAASIDAMIDGVGGAGRVTYLTNNLDYAYGLEFGTHSYGFSDQAPAGMVRINAVRFGQFVTEANEAVL